MTLKDFFYNYFGKTIVEDQGYNVINTLTYALFALFLYFIVLRKFLFAIFKKIDFKFCLSVIIFVIWGSMLRVIEEPYSTLNLVNRSVNPLELGFWFITPGIYLFVTSIVLITIFISWILEKKYHIEKTKTMIFLGIILIIPTFFYMLVNMTLMNDFFIIVLSIISFVTIIYFVLFRTKYKLNNIELLAVAGQIVDGIATFSALTFYPYFGEQHVLSDLLMQGLGYWAFPVLKIILTFVIIWYVRKSDLNYNDKNYILLFIAIFGFATGVRDLFSIACHIL